MPIYEYECTSCHHHFDLIQKINDQPPTECPQCHKDKVMRLISAAGFQLKGSGWYVTDFKNKPAEGNKKDGDTKTSSAEKKPTESKPAVKSTPGDKD